MNTTHIDLGLARYSDWAFTSSIVVLVVALLLLAVELAYSRGRQVEHRDLVAAGSVTGDGPGRVFDAPRRPFDHSTIDLDFVHPVNIIFVRDSLHY